MANNTNFLTPATKVRTVDVGQFTITAKAALPAAGINNADAIQLLTLPCAMRVTDAIIAVDATLGAGSTVQLRINRAGTFFNLAGPTTAGAASVNRMNGAPMDLLPGDIVEALVGGANITSAANLAVDLEVNRK